MTYITFLPNKVMRRILTMTLIFALTAMLMFGISGKNAFADKVECSDFIQDIDWRDTGHGDNKASEKRFEKIAEDEESTMCDLTKAIDHEKAEYKMSEKKFKSWFKDLPIWDSAYKDQKKCIEKRADLGNTLKDYEIQHCMTGEYEA